jgi:ABC-type methionine transport system ATPase subunit
VLPGVGRAKTKTGQARCLLHFERKLFNMAKAFKKNRLTQPSSPTQRRLWLMFPPKLIKKPLIWEVGQKFKVVTNIRQASVTDEIGIVCLELDGKREDVKAAIQWLEKLGVSVEPVEISVIES